MEELPAGSHFSSPELQARGLQKGGFDKLVGDIGYHPIDWADRKAEIGYWLGESFQGKGLMTEACKTLITYAFAELGLNKVEIHCAAENIRSCAIPKRLGFTQEGINDHVVTTPHSSRLRASGVTLVCRPIPSFVSTTEARPGSKQLLSRLARADVWYARAFTRGSLPRNLQTR
jgi:hypothetical protein